MAVETGIINYIIQFVINPIMWLLLIILMSVGLLGILWLRKKKKFTYPVAEIVDLGKGNGAINCDLKAGYFGKVSYLFGFFWKGEEVIKTTLGDTIVDFSTEDFQEVNGKRGIVCFRDPSRRNVLVPISNFVVENKELVASIAPSDFTDVSINIIKDADAETSDWKDKMVQFAGWALVVVFSLISIIMIVQMVKNGQEKSAELLLQAGKAGAESCKNICAQVIGQTLTATQGGIIAP